MEANVIHIHLCWPQRGGSVRPSLPRPEHCSDPGRHTGSSSNPRQDMQGSYMCSEKERAADGLGKSAKWKKWPEVPPNTRPHTRRSAEMCSTAVYQSLEIQKGNPTALESPRGSVERKISEEEAHKVAHECCAYPQAACA